MQRGSWGSGICCAEADIFNFESFSIGYRLRLFSHPAQCGALACLEKIATALGLNLNAELRAGQILAVGKHMAVFAEAAFVKIRVIVL
jgi:hypothetical protein